MTRIITALVCTWTVLAVIIVGTTTVSLAASLLRAL